MWPRTHGRAPAAGAPALLDGRRRGDALRLQRGHQLAHEVQVRARRPPGGMPADLTACAWTLACGTMLPCRLVRTAFASACSIYATIRVAQDVIALQQQKKHLEGDHQKILRPLKACSISQNYEEQAHLTVPVGNATSSTHCSPPQSKPRIWSLRPTRYPSLRRQYSASACMPCRGAGCITEQQHLTALHAGSRRRNALAGAWLTGASPNKRSKPPARCTYTAATGDLLCCLAKAHQSETHQDKREQRAISKSCECASFPTRRSTAGTHLIYARNPVAVQRRVGNQPIAQLRARQRRHLRVGCRVLIRQRSHQQRAQRRATLVLAPVLLRLGWLRALFEA